MTLLLRALCTLLGWTPATLVRLSAAFWGFVWFDVVRYRRKLMLEHLAMAFPEASAAELRRLARATCRNLVWALFDTLRIPAFKRRGFEGVRVEGYEHFEAAKAAGKGVLCLATHAGCPDLCVGSVREKAGPVSVIVKSFSSSLDRVVTDIRESNGLQVIRAGTSRRQILRALKNNEAVVSVLDQNSTRSIGVFVDFFGKSACTMAYVAVFAMKTGAAVVPCETFRDDDGVHVLKIHPAIPFEEQATKDESVVFMTQVYTDWIERVIREHPTQWFWHHKRWRTRSLEERTAG